MLLNAAECNPNGLIVLVFVGESGNSGDYTVQVLHAVQCLYAEVVLFRAGSGWGERGSATLCWRFLSRRSVFLPLAAVLLSMFLQQSLRVPRKFTHLCRFPQN